MVVWSSGAEWSATDFLKFRTLYLIHASGSGYDSVGCLRIRFDGFRDTFHHRHHRRPRGEAHDAAPHALDESGDPM
jgi:hypothetical protein